MTKQELKKALEELKKIRKAEDNLNKALKEFEPDFNWICFGRWETLFMRTLEIAMNDENKWISYWVYDMDFGKNAKSGTVRDKNGKNIPIKTISNLYDLINNKDV